MADGDSTEKYAALVEGFIKEFIYINRLDSIKDCTVDATSILKDVQEIYNLFKSGDEWAAVTQASKTALKLKILISRQCPGAPAELKAMGEWFVEKCSSKEAMVKYASENAHVHSQEMYIHVEELWLNIYSNGGFVVENMPLIGKAIADVAYWSLGPVEVASTE